MSSTNILWVDCEMTGLDKSSDVILEIAAIVTDENLNQLDSGIEFIVKTSQEVLNTMNPWCVEQHGKTGLTASCLVAQYTLKEVDDLVSEYVAKHFPEKRMVLLAGNSVHADRAFIDKDLPSLASMLHYRILDVSSIKELSRRWYPTLTLPQKSASAHRALADIQASIAELRFYREKLFLPELK